MKASTCKDTQLVYWLWKRLIGSRRASDESILAIQIFDQKKFKKKDQGFLGVINVRIGSVMDLDIGGDGKEYLCDYQGLAHANGERCRNANPGFEKVK